MKKCFALVSLIMILAAGQAHAMDRSAVVGAWRGSLDYARPDSGISRIYFGINLSEEEDKLSGVAAAHQINLRKEIEDVRLRSSGKLTFVVPFDGDELRFSGQVKDDSLQGTLVQGRSSQHVSMLRVYQGVDSSLLSSLAGVWHLEDNTLLSISPASWVLDVFELETGEYRTYFPIDEKTFVAGPGKLVLTPLEREIGVITQGDEIYLSYKRHDERQVARRMSDIEIEGVTIPAGDVVLKGLMVRPAKVGQRVPGIVVAAGSGRQNRFGFSGLPFYRAAWLASHGYAAVVFDKRGVGESSGDYETRTRELLASDVAAVADFLALDPSIDPAKVGLLAHSQSGIYAPTTIAKSKSLSFAVILSTTLVNGEVQEIIRTQQQLRADGYPEDDVIDATTTQILKFYYAARRVGWNAYVSAFEDVKSRRWFETVIGSHTDREDGVWDFWKDGHDYQPAEHWRDTKIPVLMMFGTKDTISPVPQNLEVLEELRASGAGDNIEVMVFEGLEHSLFEAEHGGVLDESELSRIANFMEVVDTWLAQGGFGPKR